MVPHSRRKKNCTGSLCIILVNGELCKQTINIILGFPTMIFQWVDIGEF